MAQAHGDVEPALFWSAPGPWLWFALALGALLRVYFAVFTEGTHDVPIWVSHAGWVSEHGLVGYYSFQEVFNHPPFIGKALSIVWEISKAVGLPFRIPHRLIFSLFDFANALLLLRFFRDSPYRWAVFAGYWINPLAILFSSYHGNTDTAVAFWVLLAVSLAVERRVAWAGVAIGVGLWFKLPTILSVPALFFFFQGARARLLFATVAFAVGATTYLPTAITAWDLLYARVLAYPGLDIVTPGGVPVWGFWNLLGIVETLPEGPRAAVKGVIAYHRAHNTIIALLPIFAFAFLRRRETAKRELGLTVLGSYLLFHGFTNFWAYQYLAWFLPFLVFAGPKFTAAATFVIFLFIYSLYAMVCGNPFLLGQWDFNAFPFWPTTLLRLRDLAVWFCLVSGVVFFVRAARREWRFWREKAGA